MPAKDRSSGRLEPRSSAPTSVEELAALGPEAQGDIDTTLLLDNLALSPLERIAAASEAASQIERLREAMIKAGKNHA